MDETSNIKPKKRGVKKKSPRDGGRKKIYRKNKLSYYTIRVQTPKRHLKYTQHCIAQTEYGSVYTPWCGLTPYPLEPLVSELWDLSSDLVFLFLFRTTAHVKISRTAAMHARVTSTAMYACFHLLAGFSMLKPLKMFTTLNMMTMYPIVQW